MSRDEKVDAYIESRAEFAKPILRHLRAAVHAACPGIEECIKWRMPAFTFKGQIIAVMAGHKAHATFHFWQRRETEAEPQADGEAGGKLGRLTAISDLPDAPDLDAMIRDTVALVDSDHKPRRSRVPARPVPETPQDLLAALDRLPGAASVFAGFPPSCRREYVEWIVEAKRPETRDKRIRQAAEWIAEGKRRNWKYENC